jgi:ribose/xylose/arabinose/galactoside ABC-type transport system permease subunit
LTDGIQYIGKFLITFGAVIVAIGGLLLLSGKIPWLGRLPGDVIIQKKNFTFYFPMATSILLSLVLTFILWLLRRK